MSEQKHLINKLLHNCTLKSHVSQLLEYEIRQRSKTSQIIINSEKELLYDGRFHMTNGVDFKVISVEKEKKLNIFTFSEYKKNTPGVSLCVKQGFKKPFTLKKALISEINNHIHLKTHVLNCCWNLNELKKVDNLINFNWTNELGIRLDEIKYHLDKIKFPCHINFKYVVSEKHKVFKTVYEYCTCGEKCNHDFACNIFIKSDKCLKLGFLPSNCYTKKVIQKRIERHFDFKNKTGNKLLSCKFNKCKLPGCDMIDKCPAATELKVDASEYKNIRRRSSAVTAKVPMFALLSEFNFISVDKVKKLNCENFTCFLDYHHDKERKSMAVDILYYDCNQKKYLLEVIKRSEDNYGLLFKEVLRKLKSISILYAVRKKVYFKACLKKLKNSTLNCKKGTIHALNLELNKYVNKLCIFCYNCEQDFFNYLLMMLEFNKLQNKKETYTVKFDNDDKCNFISNRWFFMRDLSNLFDCERICCESKLQMLKNINSEFDANKLNEEHSVVTNLIKFYNNFTFWFSKNYDFLNLSFSNITSVTLMADQMLCYESTRDNKMNLCFQRISNSSLELFGTNLSGGIVFNTTNYLKNGMNLRDSFGQEASIKNLLNYDIRSCYGHSFVTNVMPGGELLHYKLSESPNENYDENLYLQREMHCFNSERDHVYAIIWCFLHNPDLTVISAYHSFTSRGMFRVKNFSVDLTIVTKSNKNPYLSNIHFFQIDGAYFHGCLNCHTKESKYKNNMSIANVLRESNEKHSKLSKLINEIFPNNNASLKVINSCCYFKNFYDPSSGKVFETLKKFYVESEHDLIKNFSIYHNRAKKNK